MENKQKSGFVSIISEMIGRINTKFYMNSWGTFFNSLYNVETIDYSRSDYALTKAIYHASSVVGKDGKKKGEDYIFGASFGRPIINAVNAFAFSQTPKFEFKSGSETQNQQITDFVTNWLKLHKATIFNNCRWNSRDGDSYLYIKNDTEYTPVIWNGADMEIVTNPISGELVGFNRFITVVDKIDSSKNKYIKIQYRLVAPFVEVYLYKSTSDSNPTLDTEMTTQASQNVLEVDGKAVLPIIDWHNEPEASSLYGVTDYQNVFYLMANYHAVLENAIKNNIFNSNAIAFIKGVGNPVKFLQANGERGDDGELRFKWDPKRTLVGSDANFGVGFANAMDTSEGAVRILNTLFWLICQASETPEFVMGTAVQSSKASVEEQLPVILKKAENKRTQYYKYFNKTLDTLITMYKLNGNDVPEVYDYSFEFPPMVNKDLKLNLEIVKVLSEQSVISDGTKIALLDLQDVIPSVDEEIRKAREELKAKQQLSLNSPNY